MADTKKAQVAKETATEPVATAKPAKKATATKAETVKKAPVKKEATAKAEVAKKAPAKKEATAKAEATIKAPAKKAPAKKEATVKTEATIKAPTKKAPAKKEATAKAEVAKKAPAKKETVAKEAPVKTTEKVEKAPAVAVEKAENRVKYVAKPIDMERYRLKKIYLEKAVPAMMKKFGYKNINQVPRLEKIVINIGLGECKDNNKSFQIAQEELKLIAGQKPVTTLARKSVSNFKVRKGMKIGTKVTLRSTRMLDFLDKFISVVLPRVRDFRGVSNKSFDGRGNFAIGVKEQLLFTEITYDKIEKVRGMDICIVTSARTDEEAKELLTQLGMPFAR